MMTSTDLLLDKYWFFCNILSGAEPKTATLTPAAADSIPFIAQCKDVAVVADASTAVAAAAAVATAAEEIPHSKPPKSPQERQLHPPRRNPNLLRAPSLPPDIGKQLDEEEEAAAAPAPAKPAKMNKLLRSYSSLEEAVSDFRRQSSPKSTPGRRGAAGDPDSRIGVAGRYSNGRSRQASYRAVKKWKSLTDLEHEEVQGFKDLGFVFDSRERLSPVLLKMIPGLRGEAVDAEDSGGEAKVRRPYLSEAWLLQRSAPPVPNWVRGRRSAADMKEHLRFWARAVASNVRQEC